jgi:hypothetical protein
MKEISSENSELVHSYLPLQNILIIVVQPALAVLNSAHSWYLGVSANSQIKEESLSWSVLIDRFL